MNRIAAYHPGLAAIAFVVGILAAGVVRGLHRQVGPAVASACSAAVAAGAAGAVVLVGQLTRVAVGAGLLGVAVAVVPGASAGGRRPETRAWIVAGAASAAGVWAAVPDTEAPLVVAVVTTIVFTGGCGLGGAGAAFDRHQRWAWAATAAMAAVGGGWGTEQLIGGLVAAVLLAALPSTGPAPVSVVAPVVGLHVGAVAVASRVLTRWDAGPATVAGCALLVGAAVLYRALPGRASRVRRAVPERRALARLRRRRG